MLLNGGWNYAPDWLSFLMMCIFSLVIEIAVILIALSDKDDDVKIKAGIAVIIGNGVSFLFGALLLYGGLLSY